MLERAPMVKTYRKRSKSVKDCGAKGVSSASSEHVA